MVLIVIKALTWIIAISIWAIIGLYLWFPALFVATVFYVTAVFAVAFLKDRRLQWQAGTTLENAATLYQDGFPKLHHAIWDEKPEETSLGMGAAAVVKFLLLSMLFLGGATAFWYWLWRYVLARVFR